MTGHESPHADIYDPVSSSPEGSLSNRIGLENLSDNEHGDSQNPGNGRVPFDINYIQPGQEEYFPGRDRFQIQDADHMRDYVNSLVRWIADDIHIPRDSKALRKSIKFLRLNCQYSHANTNLLRSVNEFDALIGALTRDFDLSGLRNGSNVWSGSVEMEETLNLCREIVKLLEILGLSTEPTYPGLFGIMHIVYLGGSQKDMGRVVRIMHAMLYDVMLPMFDDYFDSFIYRHLQNPSALSSELSLCADVTKRFLLVGDNPPMTVYPLCKSLGTLVTRFCDDSENNRIREEYGDRCAALENVMKVLCLLCARFGVHTVSYMSRAECGVLGQIRKILKHALLHRRPGARSFNGRHLLFALLMAKFIYESPGGNGLAGPEDVKVVLDFAMSDLASRYLFNGRPRLKDLADVLVSIVLNSHCAEFVLDNWASI